MQSFSPGTPQGGPRSTTANVQTPGNKSFSHLVAGASGGMAAALLTSPLDVLRTRLQSDFYQSQLAASRALRGLRPPESFRFPRSSLLHFYETFQILFSIHRIEGWRGLFRGLGPNLIGVVPASAIKFYTYGNCKHLISESIGCQKETAYVHVAAAAIAGVVTSTATNPIWVVKTRLQLDRLGARKAGLVAAQRYRSSLDCMYQILHQEGLRGMYRGISASYLGVAESALHLALYEQMKITLARPEERAVSSAWDQAVDWIGVSGAAGASKLLAVLIAYPHEVVRTRLRQALMANGQQKYTGLVQCFRLLWKEEGLVALYGGLTPHLLRAVPSAAITLGVYEFVLKAFKKGS